MVIQLNIALKIIVSYTVKFNGTLVHLYSLKDDSN
jgi:hypothetical protein